MLRIRIKQVTGRLMLCLLTATLPCVALAQNSDALSLLLEQNQQLRNELQTLRGMVEEQSFEIRRLQRDSLNRYTDIDQRLQALEGSPAVSAPVDTAGQTTADTAATTDTGAPAAGTGITDSNVAEPVIGTGSRPATTGLNSRSLSGSANQRGQRPISPGAPDPSALSEQQLYQMAYDSVINSNFERSLSEFDQYLGFYPEGRFVTNAHYWKGQAYLYLERYDEARASYQIILDQYPDSAKLPDAMYGLALAFQGMDDIDRARELLNQIKRQFPNTGVANLADTRLLTLD